MHRRATVLKVLAPIIFIVAALHLILGLGADALLATPPTLASRRSDLACAVHPAFGPM